MNEFFAAALGGLVGSILSAVGAWRVLKDTKAARERSEQRQAIDNIAAAIVRVRIDSRGPNYPDGAGWNEHALAVLAPVEGSIMILSNPQLRHQVRRSADLITWGANNSQVRYHSGETFVGIVFESYDHVLKCLGAHARNEALPEPTPSWNKAEDSLAWVEEQLRRAEAAEQ